LQTANPVPQALHVEIEEKANGNTRMLKIGAKLREMDRQQVVHGLQLEQDLSLDDDVGTVCGGDGYSIEINLDRALALDGESGAPQSVNHACPVSAFQQAWPEPRMDMEGACEDAFGRLVVHSSSTPAAPAPMTA
jgi:hypothetical protein